jgi:hypothetical protein
MYAWVRDLRGGLPPIGHIPDRASPLGAHTRRKCYRRPTVPLNGTRLTGAMGALGSGVKAVRSRSVTDNIVVGILHPPDKQAKGAVSSSEVQGRLRVRLW